MTGGVSWRLGIVGVGNYAGYGMIGWCIVGLGYFGGGVLWLSCTARLGYKRSI